MHRTPFLALLSCLLVPAAHLSAQAAVRYRVSFPDRAHHEARVEIRYSGLEPGPLVLRMSRSSPGRYALHEFAKNVYDVRIRGVDDEEVEVWRPNPDEWDVTGHGGQVSVSYRLFGDRGDGTYSQIDRSHAHLNVPATFMVAPDLMALPVDLEVVVPEGSGWEVATQLLPGARAGAFHAPDHAYFMDSPLEIARLAWREWTVTRDGRPLTMRVAMHHLGTDAELDRYAEQAHAIGEELAAVFGTYPAFENDTYTFLACYVPWASGDGMEHRNSTMLSSTGSLATAMTALLGTVAHEFFHAWNMERIRSAELEPFDFDDVDMSRELWFGEGFTSYYDDVAPVRAGVIDEATFLQRMARAVQTVVEAPARRFAGPIEMSMQAPFVDAATSVDPTNQGNTFLSYYTWGSVIALGLDMTLRARPGEVTLDDLMRAMWQRHGEPERGYRVDDIEAALADMTGDGAFAREFFTRFVRGRDVPDFESLFRAMGVTLAPAGDPTPMLTRTAVAYDPRGMRILEPTLAGDPLYRAGLDRGDRVRTVDGQVPTSAQELVRILQAVGPGGVVGLGVESRGEHWSASVTVGARTVWLATVDPDAPGAAAARRARWVTSRVVPVGAGRR